MFEKLKAKILQFPSSSKPVEENSIFSELKAAIASSEPPDAPTAPKVSDPDAAGAPANNAPGVTFHIAIHGGTSHISTGSQINAATSSIEPVTTVKTAIDTISFAQKRQIRDLRDEISSIATECNTPKHPARVMVALNSYMNVSKYDEIRADQFDRAKSYLLVLREALTSFRSSLQVRQDYRAQMIRAIQAHYEEIGQKPDSHPLLAQKFEDGMKSDISTTQLEELYRAVIFEK